MLESLSLRNRGPAPELTFAFGERVNMITGDNDLGKTFLLDLAWWALTRSWAVDRVIRPVHDVQQDSSVEDVFRDTGGSAVPVTLKYSDEALDWSPFPRLLREADGAQLQVIATTHAPLVLASMETRWDENQDRLFNLQLTEDGASVELEEVIWARFGGASGWLTEVHPKSRPRSGQNQPNELGVRW